MRKRERRKKEGKKTEKLGTLQIYKLWFRFHEARIIRGLWQLFKIYLKDRY